MTIELQALAWTILLGLVQLMLASAVLRRQQGLDWAAGPRDVPPPPPTPLGGRLQRAHANLMETFPLFVAAVLLVVVQERQGALSQWGCLLYFWARVLYVPLYASGIPRLRSLVWAVSMIGLLLLLAAGLGA
ncbi:membrane protein [Chitiniphilus shinanonensis]|uniref:Membrane protein n=1 Tax=Chitiniphilus shinanonensis TaxID=553088 RepID=A0ABQ6BWE5_9NEIS|nr:MAPEG family protein [Chitiniphilus shinanonensis]GLS05824.1 membrane protein [Chitiniphilus shinanonensis]